MLVSIIERFQETGERDIERFAAWSSSIQRLRDDFERGIDPRIPQLVNYLDDVPEEDRSPALLDLIADHLRFSWQFGKGSTLDPYLKELAGELAEMTSPSAVPAHTVEDEFLARYQSPHGDTPPLSEYARRYPARPDITNLLKSRFLDGNRYLRLRQCGRGAMGEVWEVYDSVSRERVAVKLPGSSHDRDEAIRQFHAEATVTAGLDHPGIIHLQERHQDGNPEPLYTMRLAKGKSLSDLIESYHRPPSDRTPPQQALLLDELLGSLADLCDIIALAHAGDILHRDLKPGNIVIEPSGDTAVLDWGLATRIPSEADDSAPIGDKTGEKFAGTPDYMPPEQADGIADRRSDVFGLGAILYEILTGRAPHDCSSPSSPSQWGPVVRKADIPAPRRLLSRIPKPLEAICLKALARRPDDRYQSAAELGADLRSYLAGKPVSARAEPALARLWRSLCRGGG